MPLSQEAMAERTAFVGSTLEAKVESNDFLLAVADYGFRLLNVHPLDDSCLAWELPGYNARDAWYIVRLLSEGYR